MIFDAWTFPDGETHMPEWMTQVNRRVDGRLTYQYSKYEAALEQCTRRRVAVDIGAHIGLWSYWMARDFDALHAFEPKPAHCSCWAANVPARAGVELYAIALGDAPRVVGLETVSDVCSGHTCVTLAAGGHTDLRTLDSFGLQDVDLVKVDCEGFEYFVLQGAVDTIRRCRPVVIVEQKPGCGQRYGRGEQDAVTLLQSMGARLVASLHGDFILAFGVH